MRETWVLAVSSEMTSSRAISRLEWPRASSRSTSSSRSVRPWRAAGAGRGSGRLAARSRTSRRAVGGEMTVPPAAVWWTARSSSTGGVSLTRNPHAPARKAS